MYFTIIILSIHIYIIELTDASPSRRTSWHLLIEVSESHTKMLTGQCCQKTQKWFTAFHVNSTWQCVVQTGRRVRITARAQQLMVCMPLFIVPWLYRGESGDKAASTVWTLWIMHCLCIVFACAFLQLYSVCLIRRKQNMNFELELWLQKRAPKNAGRERETVINLALWIASVLLIPVLIYVLICKCSVLRSVF